MIWNLTCPLQGGLDLLLRMGMYSAFYGLQQEPFRLSPDPRFLHLAEPHRNTLRAMVEGIASRKGLQISVGPIGTGKTTLLYCLQHLLMHEASPQCPVR